MRGRDLHEIAHIITTGINRGMSATAAVAHHYRIQRSSACQAIARARALTGRRYRALPRDRGRVTVEVMSEIVTRSGTFIEIRRRLSCLHFAKESLTDRERAVLADAEALLGVLDSLTTRGHLAGYWAELAHEQPDDLGEC